MRGSRVLATMVLAVAGALSVAGPAAAAPSWTPVASGTAGTISAIATPKAGEVVFTTTAGKIFHMVGGTFVEASLNTPMLLAFKDVAMSADGTVGIAVGAAGAIYRSSDSGADWTKLVGIKVGSGACGGAEAELKDDLFSVHFAGETNTAFITGANNDLLKSTDGGAHWTEVNKRTTECVLDETIGDTAWLSPSIGYLLSDDFGDFWRTTDGLAGAVGGTSKLADDVLNEFRGGARLALDADDPQRLWAINPGTGGLDFAYTVNGGSTWNQPNLGDGSLARDSFNDIAAGIGTNVVAVGAGGAIYTSTDGVNFAANPAGAPNATNTWEAVAFQPGSTTAWVGGTNGALLTTDQANVLPTAPVALPPVTTSPTTPIIHGGPKRALCRVPNLKGKSLKAAAKKLKAANCRLGKVMKKKGATAKDGKVTKESQKPGKTFPAGTKIKLTLAP